MKESSLQLEMSEMKFTSSSPIGELFDQESPSMDDFGGKTSQLIDGTSREGDGTVDAAEVSFMSSPIKREAEEADEESQCPEDLDRASSSSKSKMCEKVDDDENKVHSAWIKTSPSDDDEELLPSECVEASLEPPTEPMVVDSSAVANHRVADSTSTSAMREHEWEPSSPGGQSDLKCIGKVVFGPKVCALVMSRSGGNLSLAPSPGVKFPPAMSLESRARPRGLNTSRKVLCIQTLAEQSQEPSNENYIELLGNTAMSGQKNRIFLCDQCGTKFLSRESVLEHLKEHRGKVRCGVCSAECGSRGGLKRHIAASHSGEAAPDSAATSSENDSSEEKTDLDRETMTKWLKSDHPKELYKCNDCSKTYKHKERLAEHVVVHTKRSPHLCTVCSRPFATSNALKLHQVTHSTIKPFACSKCPMAFKRVRALHKHHSAVHMRERPFDCEVCGKCFATKSGLKTHVTVHTSDKPYACDQCPKSFGQKFQLRIHMSVHTGIRPYTCDICSKSYTLKHYLRDHMKKHTGVCIFCCRWCKDTFPKKTELVKHMKTAHKDSME